MTSVGRIIGEIAICILIFLAIFYVWYEGRVERDILERKILGIQLRVYRQGSEVVHLMNLDNVVKGMIPRLEGLEKSHFDVEIAKIENRLIDVEKKMFPEKFETRYQYGDWGD